MKHLLFVLFLFGYTTTNAQQHWKDDIYESGTFAADFIEPATGKRSVRAKEDLIFINDGDTLILDIVKPKGGKIAMLGVVESDDLCLSKNAPVYIEFVNSEVENFESQTEKNCTGNVNIYMGGKWKHKKVIDKLRYNLVRKISIGGIDENHYYFLTREEALDLRKTINCVLYLQDDEI